VDHLHPLRRHRQLPATATRTRAAALIGRFSGYAPTMTPAAVTQTQQQRGGRAPARICGAATRRGTGPPCKRGRGWGTDHPGYGNCKRHGGATPSGKISAAKEAAMIAAQSDYGGESDVDPLEALLYTVRRGARLVAFWQAAAMRAEDPDEFAAASANEARALNDLNRWAKNAVDGGVAERQVRIAERFGDSIVAAAEEALAALETALGATLSVEARTAYASAFGQGLARLESGVIEGTALDD
jgi:hypothetical protein